MGAAMFMCWENKNVWFSLNHVNIPLDNRNKSYKTCKSHGEAFSGKLWQKSAFWKVDSWGEKPNQWKVQHKLHTGVPLLANYCGSALIIVQFLAVLLFVFNKWQLRKESTCQN